MEQLGTGRAENPSWKTEADLPKTDTASLYFGNTRNHLQVFPEMTRPTPDWVQLRGIQAIQLRWHMALSRQSWGGSAGLEKTTLLHVAVPTRCGLEREILWILTGLLGLLPGPALRLQWEESLERLRGAAIASPVTRELQPERLCSSHPPWPLLTGASETQPGLALFLLTHPLLTPSRLLPHFIVEQSAS